MLGKLKVTSMARMVKFLVETPIYIDDVQPEWFKESPDIMYIVEIMKTLKSSSYNGFTADDVAVVAESDGKDADFYVQFFNQIMTQSGEITQSIADNIIGWISWLKLRDSIGEALELMTSADDAAIFTDISAKCRLLIENSQISSRGTSVGMDFFDVDSHHPDEGRYTPCMWSMIPKGYELGTLVCYLGEANIGKSIFLCNEAVSTAKSGDDVLIASFEMSEQRIAARLAGSVLGLRDDQYSDLVANNRGKLKAMLAEARDANWGRIKIKQFPTSVGTVEDIRYEIHKMRDKGMDPKKIVVDYLGIMASRNRRTTDLYEKLKSITEELRALAIEEQVVVVTAGQINRSGFGMDEIGFESIAECAAILHTCDTILAITQTEDYRAANLYRLKALKIRDGAGKGVVTNVNIDYNHMKLEEDASTARQILDQLAPPDDGISGIDSLEFRSNDQSFDDLSTQFDANWGQSTSEMVDTFLQ